jgi:hypothetical protein
MPLNLKGLKKFIEGEMVDEIVITRDPEGTEDNIFNRETGEYDNPPGDNAVWYRGKAIVVQLNVFPSQAEDAGGTTLSTDYEVHVPLETPRITLYDRILVTKCMRTPHLVGTEFRMRSNQDNTFSVSQAVRVYRWEQKLAL